MLGKASRLAAGDQEVSKLKGDIALTRARIADNQGDIALALRSYQEARSIFARLGILRSQAIALQGLGSIYDEAHDFAREIEYYRQASLVYPPDTALKLSAANNIGFALLETGRYGEAVEDFKGALKIAIALKSELLESSILTNLAAAYAKQHKFIEAEAAVNRALKLLGANRDLGGQAPFVWGVKAGIEYQRGALQAAVADIQRAFHGIDPGTTIAPFRDIHESAYKIFKAAGDLPLSIAHLEAFKRLDDQGRALAASANLALMAAQFDFAAQQLEIEHLKSAQFQRDIKLGEERVVTQRVIFAAGLFAGAIFLLWFMWRHMLVRRHRNAIARKNAELTAMLAERDLEIARRSEVEGQLRVAMEAAQNANLAKSHFLANMSHELRTPLNAIIGFSELMIGGDVRPERVSEYALCIAEGGRNLLAILSDILDMARIEAGTVRLEEGVVQLGDAVDSAIALLGSKLRMANRKIIIAGDGKVFVRADAHKLHQVLGNLLSNAIKFTNDSGSIVVRIEVVPDGVDITVEDDGCGIAADKIATIMQPFGQVEGTYARAHGGTGLGLPIVKSLVEMHGGRFTLSSKAGVGTHALVHLPLDRIQRDFGVVSSAA